MLWPNRHRRFRHRLSAYLDGQLTAGETEALERHLVACPACRQLLEELRATALALRHLPQEEVPHSFALMPQQVARPAPPRPAPASPVLATGMRLAGAALAFALAAVLVVDLGDLRGDGGDAMTPLPAPAEMPAPQKESDWLGATDAADEEGVEAFREVTPLAGAEAAAPSPPVDEAKTATAPYQPSPPAAELQEGAEPGGGLDPLRAAEVALAATLGLLVVSSLTLAFARRKR